MAPLIKTGDSVSIRLMDVKMLKTGDIFAFWEGKNIVVHRVIKKEQAKGGWRICQRGDNLSRWSWIHGSKVLGKVEEIYGGGRRLDMTCRPWTWTNPAFAFISWILICFFEKMHTLKISFWGNRSAYILSRLKKWPFKALNRVNKFF